METFKAIRAVERLEVRANYATDYSEDMVSVRADDLVRLLQVYESLAVSFAMVLGNSDVEQLIRVTWSDEDLQKLYNSMFLLVEME